MSICSIKGCPNELSPNTRLTTCKTCRQSLHQIERRKLADIVRRADNLTKYQDRLSTVAHVEEGEARLIDRDILVKRRIMIFTKPRPRNRKKS